MKKYICLLMLSLFASACAHSECVFDESILSDAKLKSNTEIVQYTWDDKKKEAKGITKNGTLFSAKYWACTHYGAQVTFFLGPYYEIKNNILNEEYLKLAKFTLQNEEFQIIKNILSKEKILLSATASMKNYKIPQFSEFYLSQAIAGDFVILEIKFYKD